jgi:1-deoxy-D-xylulose-5-phosphate reductoisomerase
MKKIALWGASGSIGKNTLEVFRQHPDYFTLVAFSVHRNVAFALEIIKEFRPEYVVVTDKNSYQIMLENASDLGVELLFGQDALVNLSGHLNADLVVNALVGEAGLRPSIAALQNGLHLALANKESLVMAGALVNQLKDAKNLNVFPIDSEHSAIWQCLAGEDMAQIRRIILTASGGPFRTFTAADMATITPAKALKHPTWKMGSKITIDSATLMNKGLEYIETYWLYPVTTKQIDVVVHPQSIIHSFVEFIDGSQKAQLGIPDMKIPIQYALTYPERLPLNVEIYEPDRYGHLTFEAVDHQRFPALNLARNTLEAGGLNSAVMNVANEYAVYAFLDHRISYQQIYAITEQVVAETPSGNEKDLDTILQTAGWAHNRTEELIAQAR